MQTTSESEDPATMSSVAPTTKKIRADELRPYGDGQPRALLHEDQYAASIGFHGDGFDTIIARPKGIIDAVRFMRWFQAVVPLLGRRSDRFSLYDSEFEHTMWAVRVKKKGHEPMCSAGMFNETHGENGIVIRAESAEDLRAIAHSLLEAANEIDKRGEGDE